MNKLLIGILVTIFFSSCAGSKNATHQSDDTYIVIPIQDHYSINGWDYYESWRVFNEAKLTLY
jgi:hypothetical protein